MKTKDDSAMTTSCTMCNVTCDCSHGHKVDDNPVVVERRIKKAYTNKIRIIPSMSYKKMLVMTVTMMGLVCVASISASDGRLVSTLHGRQEDGTLHHEEDRSLRAITTTSRGIDELSDKEKVNTSSITTAGDAAGSQHRSLNILQNFRWKERSEGRALIPYSLSRGGFTSTERSQIRSALDDLERKTGCLKFLEYTNQRNYIEVKRDPNLGCQSRLGRKGGPQDLNLKRGGCFNNGIIQHEFLHAIGFHHEQTRPDRGSYVTINLDNLTDIKRYRHNFEVATRSDTLGSPYDYGSVMHYRQTAFAKSGTNTIDLRRQFSGRVGQRDGVSSTDVNKVKLLYQCDRGIVRDWASLNRSPCTSDCKCRQGDTGCGTNDDACHGSLVCSSNTCTTSTGPTPSPPSPPTPTPSPSSTTYIIWRDENYNGSDYCMDLKARVTTNGNQVWYYQCNFTPAQYWYFDTENYIRSIIDRNKCLVPTGGRTDQGTSLMIHDCFANDDRFRWDYYADKSIRPRNNKFVCIEQRHAVVADRGIDLILDSCNTGFKEWNFYAHTPSGGTRRLLQHNMDSAGDSSPSSSTLIAPKSNARSLEMTDESMVFEQGEDCEDAPLMWYDFMGRNCLWYSEDVSRCEMFGDSYKNFGVTAMTACCACGGGTTAQSYNYYSDVDFLPGLDNLGGCWDAPDFYDSTGDGCTWYEEEDTNCEYFGWQFTNQYGQNANSACCSCGGGLSDPPSEDDFMSESSDAVPDCSNSPYDWMDDNGDDCSWYELSDSHCDEFGNNKGLGGLTAKEVCCACGGGMRIDMNEEDEKNGGSLMNLSFALGLGSVVFTLMMTM